MISKSNIILFSFLLFCGSLVAQKINRCASHTKLLEAMAQDESLRLKIEQSKQTTSAIYSGQRTESTYPIITIPVVVHVLYKTAQQNINDAQIRSQIDVLNRDFNARNADSLPINHEFYNLIGNASIEFCLASVKPGGSSTTGIERKQVTYDGFEYSDADESIIKSTSNGGLSAWNTSKYLNIWIVNFTDGTLGYATFPEDNSGNKDGVVIAYDAFGTVGVLTPDYDKGRTSTHEIGHWLGLYHIWGDDYNCTADDGIEDTPKQYEDSYGCPCEHPKVDNCSPSIMYQNFMDYTDDACMSLFTKDQVTRMRNVLSTASNRTSFLNNTVACNTHTPTSDNSVYCDVTLNNNISINHDINIFPNPVRSTLFIEKLPPSISNYDIKIFNSIGAEVLSKQININQTSLDVSSLNAGIYYLHISNHKIKMSTIVQVIK